MKEDTKTGQAPISGGGLEQPSMAADDYFRAGMLFLKREKYREALSAFKHALELPGREPLSFLHRFCLAHGETGKEAVSLCEKAVIRNFTARSFLNLGRVYLLTGNKKAHQTFWKGYALTGTTGN
jgi:tetratricopeptide (TPR) repeat protein